VLTALEQTTLQLSEPTSADKKLLLGQFFTPANIAKFMASLFPAPLSDTCTLLDAGAGAGSLASAFLERCASGQLNAQNIRLSAFELDNSVHAQLHRSLSQHKNKTPLLFTIIGGDFIEAAVNTIQSGQQVFTHAILNPPYKKISSNSRHRLLLRQVGIETVNLYSAFVALTLLLMAPEGQVVAIIPRSFCNGPYYRPFRDFVLKHAAIRHIHLFASRRKAFKADAVLQENIIIRLERGRPQETVTVSTSTDDSFSDFASYEHPFDNIVFADDPNQFIHIPTSSEKNAIELSPAIRYSLADLGITVSTGPVVDFRLKKHLCAMPESGTAPLLYPGHFSRGGLEWPKVGSKKPNAIHRNLETEKWLYPNSFYCVVRRFSAKEERRRIVASVVEPTAFQDAPLLGFENHLNLFHENKQGLSATLAHGLCLFLNTTAFDESFRRFSGHTQVNATDLKIMKYPSRSMLIEMGKWAMAAGGTLTQMMIDEKLRELNS
jgi:tRNA1(Val) A37 N6-methylase TrmN6